MIWGELKVSVEQRLAARLLASAFRFHSHENCIDLSERLRVIELKDPPFLRRVVLIENPKIEGLLSVRTAPAPSLKRAGIPGSRFFVQVIGVKE